MDKTSIQFSERERDVIQLLLQGKGNKQIALELGIANRTVEFHLSNVYEKLEVSSRAEAILKLTESDLRKSAGDYQVNSTVDQSHESTKNGFKSISWRSLVRKPYYILGGLFLTILIAAVIIFRVPKQNLETATPAETATAIPIEVSSPTPPPTATQITNLSIPPHTVNGYTATIESYYVDISHLIFHVRIEGGDIKFGDEYYYGRIHSPDIYNKDGNMINTSGGFGPAIHDPTLIEMRFEPVTLFTENHLKGQLAFEINNAPAYNEILAKFSFDFDIPVYPEVRFNPKQTVTANGLEVLVDSITITPTYTQIYVCFQSPSFAPWNISSNSKLQIGDQIATLHSSRLLFNSAVGGDKRGTSEPYWVPPIKDGICMKNGFAIGSDSPTSLTLTIPALEADKDAGAILLTNQLTLDYPGLSIRDAYSKYLEENGNTYKGPWIFVVELSP